MLLVTGATGQLGSAVVSRLLERTDPSTVSVLVRDPAKAADLAARGVHVHVGDYDDRAALDRALKGVERMLLVAGNDPQRRMQQHQNVIDAAVTSQVELIGFASRTLRDISASQNSLMADYFDTEDRIRRSGLAHVFFRNALYLDTVPLYVGGPAIFDTRSIRLPAGTGAVAYALRRELGEAIANAMLEQDAADQTHILAASHASSFDDVAAALSHIAGHPVTYTNITDEEYVSASVHRGLPEPMARRFLGFFHDIRDGQLDQTSDDLTTMLGRPPVSLDAGLRELFDR